LLTQLSRDAIEYGCVSYADHDDSPKLAPLAQG